MSKTVTCQAPSPLGRFVLLSLVALPLVSLPSQAALLVEYVGVRQGYDSEGNPEEAGFDGYLDNGLPGLENRPFIAAGDNLSGSVFSAGGPLGASALASYGYLRAETNVGGVSGVGFAGVTTHQYSGDLRATSIARFEDEITINAPGMAGGAGFFTAHFGFQPYAVVDGFVLPEGPGSQFNARLLALAHASWIIGNQSDNYQFRTQIVNTGTETVNTFPDEELQVQVAFTYGVPFDISFRINAHSRAIANANGFAQGRAIAGFPSSMHWLGMSDLAPDASVTSASGAIDWRQATPLPVPEPDARLLPMIVLAGLAARQGRRKQNL